VRFVACCVIKPTRHSVYPPVQRRRYMWRYLQSCNRCVICYWGVTKHKDAATNGYWALRTKSGRGRLTESNARSHRRRQHVARFTHLQTANTQAISPCHRMLDRMVPMVCHAARQLGIEVFVVDMTQNYIITNGLQFSLPNKINKKTRN